MKSTLVDGKVVYVEDKSDVDIDAEIERKIDMGEFTAEELITHGIGVPPEMTIREVSGSEDKVVLQQTETGSQREPPDNPPDTQTELLEPEESRRRNKGDEIRELLLQGVSREDCVNVHHHNPNSVRTIYSELKTAGMLPHEPKKPTGSKAIEKATPQDIDTYGKPTKAVVGRGSSSPEAIVQGFNLPEFIDGNTRSFESGMKFGMSAIIIGVKVAQELAEIGAKQVRPLVDMAKEMRAGEAAVARDAAMEAAQIASEQTAGQVAGIVSEQISRLTEGKGTKEIAASSGNPMADEMRKMMMPLMKGIIKQVMPPQLAAMMDDGDSDGLPDGWKKG